MKTSYLFSASTLLFLKKASRQKNPNWLDKNRKEFEQLVRFPLQSLALKLAQSLRAHAPGYHFPTRGLGRLKRSAIKAQDHGSLYKNYVSFTVTKPSDSRFDHQPSIFFMINSADQDGDEVLLAGGLYMPSSRQLKTIRERIAQNPTPFEALFRSKRFSNRFTGGFSTERTATRVPRGFDANHSHIHWLKLQGFFVWRSYSKKQYCSPGFAELIIQDAKQLLRLNELLDLALSPHWPEKSVGSFKSRNLPRSFLELPDEQKVVLHKPDF